MPKATTIANANIALVKYWGKRNKELMLPQTGSISMTTEGLQAHTTVEFDSKYENDIVIVNGKEYKQGDEEYDDYVGVFLSVVRQAYPDKAKDLKVKIVSNNNFPTAAGLASSAAGFAALAAAVNEALGLNLDQKQLSMLARRGSGSATRSISGGFVEWKGGELEDGSDCFAEQLFPPEHWPELRMVIAVTSKKDKKVKSRAGMSASVKTSPYYSAWKNDVVPKHIEAMKKAIAEKDFKLLGQTAETNAIMMHAVAFATTPPVIYWNAGTMDIVHAVMDWRDAGMDCYFTIDGGPQVKVLCREKDVEEIKKRLKDFDNIEDVIVTQAGNPVKVVDNHLF
jgi:diphosphomevalonate decarboxylase